MRLFYYYGSINVEEEGEEVTVIENSKFFLNFDNRNFISGNLEFKNYFCHFIEIILNFYIKCQKKEKREIWKTENLEMLLNDVSEIVKRISFLVNTIRTSARRTSATASLVRSTMKLHRRPQRWRTAPPRQSDFATIGKRLLWRCLQPSQ